MIQTSESEVPHRGLVSVEDGHRGDLPVIGQLPKIKAIGDIFDLARASNRNS